MASGPHEVVSLKGHSPRERVIEGHPHGINIRADGHVIAPQLLGGRECQRAENRAGHGQLGFVADGAGDQQAKVATLIVPSISTKQLEGLTSRCSTPADAAASSPATI